MSSPGSPPSVHDELEKQLLPDVKEEGEDSYMYLEQITHEEIAIDFKLSRHFCCA